MKNIINEIQYVITAIGAFFGYFTGGVDGFLYALITFMIIDYITGVMIAIIQKQLSSAIGSKGLFNKMIIIALVGIANTIDVNILKNGSVVRTSVVFFYLSNEGISILENVAKLGLPIPEKLKKILIQIQEEDETHE